jgi:hypothetical protein
MPSTFSTSLRLELPSNGEQSGTWGQTLNKDLGTLIEQAITGVGSIDLSGYSSYTLSNFNGLPDEARNAVLVFSGTLTSNIIVTTPTVEKTYIVSNQTAGGYSVTLKTSGGNGVAVLYGTNQLVYCDGTDFYTGVSVNSIFGNMTVSGNAIVSNATVIVGNATVNNNVISSTTNIGLNANSAIISMAPNTGGFVPPTGTTAQRPSAPKAGTARWNFDLGAYEVWNGLAWENITAGNYGVTYLVVSGGGAGGSAAFNFGGGGGAGGVLTGTANVAANTSYPVVIGAGGSANGGSGSNSSVFGINSYRGGGGSNGSGGLAGGSGGGGDTNTAGGAGTSGQGNAGCQGAVLIDGQTACGGAGGGWGQIGGASGYPPDGGNGQQSSISGTATYYAGGGGGGAQTSGTIARGGFGGLGGGGAGSGGISGGGPTSSVAGTANTGGGGGAGASGGSGGSNGGSGVVIVSYANPTQRGTGGTVTSYTSGSTKYWVHTFTSSGNYVA